MIYTRFFISKTFFNSVSMLLNFFVNWASNVASVLLNTCNHRYTETHFMDTFFWVGKNFQNKISKKQDICDNFLNFWNNQRNSWKNFFIVSIIGLHTWNSKVRSKNWEKWSCVFLLFENHFLWFKTKITYPALYWYLKN